MTAKLITVSNGGLCNSDWPKSRFQLATLVQPVQEMEKLHVSCQKSTGHVNFAAFSTTNPEEITVLMCAWDREKRGGGGFRSQASSSPDVMCNP